MFPRALAFAAVVLLVGTPGYALEIGSFDRTLNVTGAVDLQVKTNSGAVSVRPASANSVRIHAVMTVPDAATDRARQRACEIEANPPIRQSGNSIRIEPLQDLSSFGISISYEIETPRTTTLRTQSGSGSQNIEGIQGPVHASIGSGSIRIRQIDEAVHAETGSGSIDLTDIRGRTHVATGSGGIHAINVAGPLEAKTGSGAIAVQLAGTGGFDIHARTGSGRISVAPALVQNTSNNRHTVEGKIRGGGPLVELATGSGAVEIN